VENYFNKSVWGVSSNGFKQFGRVESASFGVDLPEVCANCAPLTAQFSHSRPAASGRLPSYPERRFCCSRKRSRALASRYNQRMPPRTAIPVPHSGDPDYADRALPQYERAVMMAGGNPSAYRSI
jgi:hypothetical protein